MDNEFEKDREKGGENTSNDVRRYFIAWYIETKLNWTR